MRFHHRPLPYLLVITLFLAACQTPQQAQPTLIATAVVDPNLVDGSSSGVLQIETITASVVEDIQPTVQSSATPIPPTPTTEPTSTPEPTLTPTPTGPITYTYNVLASYPHDANAWTQGLVIDDGALFEGTGQWGESDLREVALETGSVLRSSPLDSQYFGEGITVLGDRIFQLTWQDNIGFVYDRNSFEQLQTFSYPTEGWGITTDGTRLIVSDGTSTIYFWDPATLSEIGRIEVRDAQGPVNMLNELEYIDGEIWANIWLEDRIARISPETGMVTGWIDMSGLLDPSTLTQPADVLNGIAYDAATGSLFVTGKYWPTLFQIEVVPGP